jgi:hypothetical protein
VVMSLRYPKKAQIKIEGKTYDIEGFFESELGYLMLRLYNIESKTFITYNLGFYDKSENFITLQIIKA